MEGKKTKGKQKIEMKKIENDEDRLITLSKRRSGIYKKASELVTLCGAEVGVLVFSPAGKPFTFGHPTIDHVANRFLNQNFAPNDHAHPLVEAHRKVRVSELNQLHNELINQFDAEKEKGKVLAQMMKGKQSLPGRWETPIEELSEQELQEMSTSLYELHQNLRNKIKERSTKAISLLLPPPENTIGDNTNGAGPSNFPPSYGSGASRSE